MQAIKKKKKKIMYKFQEILPLVFAHFELML